MTTTERLETMCKTEEQNRARIDDHQTNRKKRYMVYSHVDAGNPVLVDSFDLREDAVRLIDRLTAAYGDIVRCHGAQRPRLTLVDAKADTMELIS